MKKENGIKIIVFLSALVLLYIFYINVRNDYYYQFTKKETVAIIKEIKKLDGVKPFLITIKFFNEYTLKECEGSLKLDGKFGKKILDGTKKEISIVYTKKPSFNFYIVGYKNPNFAGFIIHIILFIITLFGAVLFFKEIFNSIRLISNKS